MNTSSMLVLSSALIILFLGAAHLAFTFRGPKLRPRDQGLVRRMQSSKLVLTPQTDMWRAWIGFNASHSAGAILFSALYGYLALAQAELLFGSVYLQAVGALFLFALMLLAKRFWFRTPFAGITASLVCFLGGIALAHS